MTNEGNAQKEIKVEYYAILREQRGVSCEKWLTSKITARELYEELSHRYHLGLPCNMLKVAINNEFKDMDTKINQDDTVVFIPPVAGG